MTARSKAETRLRPPGYRACYADVSTFLTAEPVAARLHPNSIPLRFPYTPASTPVPSRTLTFPPPLPIPRSPFRPTEPPPSLLLRLRPIGNPVVLRLLALQNILGERGKEWEGRAPDGALGCGKERLVGVGWEGLGPSGLSVEKCVIFPEVASSCPSTIQL